ncbi:MAG: hypothetical protein AAF593_10260, partial [Planctomycetota bacterium]
RGKKSEYVLNERRMQTVLGGLGLEDSELIVYGNHDNADRAEATRIAGEDLGQVLEALTQLDDLVEIVKRRGLTLAELLAMRSQDPGGEGKLPKLQIDVAADETSNGLTGSHFFWSENEEEAFREKNNLVVEDPDLPVESPDRVFPPGQRVVVRRELHEVVDLEKVFAKLEALGLDIQDYFLKPVPTVTGAMAPTKFELVAKASSDSPKITPLVNLAEVAAGILDAGRQGLEIKRFKGLGEMDADQLWDTTMNPENRTLMRVTWDAASEAESLFSVLMGEHVEPRRKYIEDHALEVKNLDV